MVLCHDVISDNNIVFTKYKLMIIKIITMTKLQYILS